jgi:hypothetical protein
MKRLGARAGVSDLFCGWCGGYSWIELQANDGRVSFPQSEFAAWVIQTKGNFAYAKIHRRPHRSSGSSVGLYSTLRRRAAVPVSFPATIRG